MLYTYNNRQMKTSQYFVGKTLILFGAIIIGIPLGIIHGLILFFNEAIRIGFGPGIKLYGN